MKKLTATAPDASIILKNTGITIHVSGAPTGLNGDLIIAMGGLTWRSSPKSRKVAKREKQRTWDEVIKFLLPPLGKL